MNTEPENPAASSETAAPCHPAIRKWIFLRGLLIGLLVAGWWILFAPDDLMSAQLKTILGVLAGLVATASYLFNLRSTLFPPQKP